MSNFPWEESNTPVITVALLTAIATAAFTATKPDSILIVRKVTV